MQLNQAQLERYARQLNLPPIGAAGQKQLLASRVLLVGAGGLGSAAGFYLCAAGIGTLGIMDSDRVEPSNLQRQIWHFTRDIGRSKVMSAAAKLRALNPDVAIQTYRARLEADNARRLIRQYDLVVDATDNFAARQILAAACHALHKPYVHGAVCEFSGQILTVRPGRSACWACLFNPPPDERLKPPRGPLGVVPGVIGAIQATEAVKMLLGIGEPLINRLLIYDALALTFRQVQVRRDRRCRVCGQR